MKVFYSKINNFGDRLNEFFWSLALPGLSQNEGLSPSNCVLFGVGSLLNDDNLRRYPNKRIFGSGAGYGPLVPFKNYNENDVLFVRGPLTCELMKLDKGKAIADPAFALPRFPDWTKSDIRISRFARRDPDVIFVPHHYTESLSLDLKGICEKSDIRYVSPAQSPRQVIADIASARKVIAESMHAAILADAYRVPWIPVSVTSAINKFKWQDFFASVNMGDEMIDLLRRERQLKELVHNSLFSRGGKNRIRGQVEFELGETRSEFSRRPEGRERTVMFKLGMGALLSFKLSRLTRHAGFLSDDRVVSSRQDLLLSTFKKFDR